MGNKQEVRKLHALKALAVIALVIVLYGCEIPRETKNMRTGEWDSRVILTVTAPTGMFGYEDANWSASWSGGRAPYTIAWDFGGGAPNIATAPGVSPVDVTVTMNDAHVDATFTYTVTVTDSNGLTSSASRSYYVGTTRNLFPTISTAVVGGTVICTINDDDGDDITVSVTAGSGFGDPAPMVVAGGSGDAVFNFSSSNLLAGSAGTVEFTADDWNGGTASATAIVIFDAMVLDADTIYAIPMAASAAVDAPVTIVVATGATGSFQFMLGVGLVIPADGSYVEDTFNVGAIGGNTDDADGVWGDITSDGGFILGPDSLIRPGANPEDTIGTSSRFDFNISPLGGTDVASATGELFNAQFSFSAAGTKTISFQEVNGVNRTYYTDIASGTNTFWGSYVDGTIDVS